MKTMIWEVKQLPGAAQIDLTWATWPSLLWTKNTQVSWSTEIRDQKGTVWNMKATIWLLLILFTIFSVIIILHFLLYLPPHLEKFLSSPIKMQSREANAAAHPRDIEGSTEISAAGNCSACTKRNMMCSMGTRGAISHDTASDLFTKNM